MKKITGLKIVGLIGFLLSTISCSKDTNNLSVENNSTSQITQQYSTVEQPCSPNNPNNNYDDSGEEHNNMLNFVHQNYPNFDNLSFAQQHDIVDSNNLQVSIVAMEETNMNQLITDFNNGNTSDFVNSTDLSTAGKSMLSSFLDELFDSTFVANYSYCNLKTLCLTYEGNVSISTLPEEDKIVLYHALSIFRHSGSYWNEVYNLRPNLQPTAWVEIVTLAVDAAAGVASYYLARRQGMSIGKSLLSAIGGAALASAVVNALLGGTLYFSV